MEEIEQSVSSWIQNEMREVYIALLEKECILWELQITDSFFEEIYYPLQKKKASTQKTLACSLLKKMHDYSFIILFR